MSTKPLDRLLFAQGGLCFFCGHRLPQEQASIEHLHATANGGANADENCVACCKTLNQLLGSRSLKEKFQVVLNQRGQFRCPNGVGSAKPAAAPATPPQVATPPKVAAPQKPAAQPKRPKPAAPPVADPPAPNGLDYNRVVAYLQGNAKARPRTVKTLTNAIAARFKDTTPSQAAALVQQLVKQGLVKVEGTKVTYSL